MLEKKLKFLRPQYYNSIEKQVNYEKMELGGPVSCCIPPFFVSRASTQLDEGPAAHCVGSDGGGWLLVRSDAEQSIKGAHFKNDEGSREPTES